MCSQVPTMTASKSFGRSKTRRRSLSFLACGYSTAALSTAVWSTSQRTTTFSSGCGATGPAAAAPPRAALSAAGPGRPAVRVSSLMRSVARPPEAMNAMFSLSFRFRPRRNAGAPVITPAAARAPPTNSRRVI